jgi:hypothetical protein
VRIVRGHLASVLILIFTVGIVLREYFYGTKSPSWDFVNDYFTASYVWWNAGSFFNPPSYLPYAFSGFPAHLSGQAANWYLPVGILAELNMYNIHTSAILQTITIMFGVIGFYFLANSWGISKYIALVAAVGYFFSPGFFTSASHIDIVRGWAFIPWIFLAFKPKNNISAIQVFLIAFLAFQYMVGVYPGIIIASIYLLGIYVLLNFYFESNLRKQYVLYQLLPFLMGVFLSFLKWLPLVTAERLYRGGNTVEVTPAIISTLIYSYDTLVLPNDITMRSFFLAPILLISIFLLQKITRPVLIYSLMALVAIALGFDLSETSRWQEALPFLSESRFRTTDFKLFWILSTIMLAGFALQQVKERGISLIRGATAIVLAFFTFTYLNRLAKTALLEDMLRPGNNFARIAGAIFVLMTVFFFLSRYFKFTINLSLTLALFGTLFIGYQWTEVNKTPWNTDRIGIEQIYYGMTVDKRIVEGKTRIINLRPERIGPEFPIPYPIALTSQMWSNSEINKTFSLGGYVPLKGIPRYEQMIEFAKTSESVPFYTLLAKAQTGWLVNNDAATLDSINCIYDQSCLVQESTVTPASWDISKLEFEISSPSDALMVVNEIPWDGWRAKVCDSNNCKVAEVNTELDQLLLAVQVEASTEKVVFEYFQPYKEISWIIFWIALALIIMIAYARTLASKI